MRYVSGGGINQVSDYLSFGQIQIEALLTWHLAVLSNSKSFYYLFGLMMSMGLELGFFFPFPWI